MVSIFLILGIVVLIIAMAICCAGYGTNHWMTKETVLDKIDISVGLWKMSNCTNDKTYCYTDQIADDYKSGMLTATLALATAVLASTILVFLLYLVFTLKKKTRTVCMKKTIIILCALGVLFTVVVIVLWIVQLPENFYASWSFGMVVFSGFLLGFAAFLLLLSTNDNENENEKQSKPKKRAAPPPPVQVSATPSVPPFTPHWHERQYTPTTTSQKKLLTSVTPVDLLTYEAPASPVSGTASPTQIRVSAHEPLNSQDRHDFFSTSSSSQATSRRYGTPESLPTQRTQRTFASPTSYHSRGTPSSYISQSTSRRYGTPKYATRYDNRAR